MTLPSHDKWPCSRVSRLTNKVVSEGDQNRGRTGRYDNPDPLGSCIGYRICAAEKSVIPVKSAVSITNDFEDRNVARKVKGSAPSVIISKRRALWRKLGNSEALF